MVKVPGAVRWPIFDKKSRQLKMPHTPDQLVWAWLLAKGAQVGFIRPARRPIALSSIYIQSNRVPKIPQIKIPALADLVDLRFLDASERSELRKLPILATKLYKIVIF